MSFCGIIPQLLPSYHVWNEHNRPRSWNFVDIDYRPFIDFSVSTVARNDQRYWKHLKGTQYWNRFKHARFARDILDFDYILESPNVSICALIGEMDGEFKWDLIESIRYENIVPIVKVSVRKLKWDETSHVLWSGMSKKY